MSKSKTFYLQSGGAAYDLDVGFVSDRVIVRNRTKWASDGIAVKHYWNRWMTDAYADSEITDDTGVNRSLQTTNGFTPISTNSVTSNQATISGASQASPCVLSVTSHGFGNADDVVTVRVRDVVGMVELNGNMYKAVIVDANYVRLLTMTGDNLDSSGFTTYGSGGVLFGLSLIAEDEGFTGITLGTGVVGANSDWLEVTCYQDDMAVMLGDIG